MNQGTRWTQIKQSTAKGISLSTLPFINMKSGNSAKIENEWIKHTLKVWTIVRKKTWSSIICVEGHANGG